MVVRECDSLDAPELKRELEEAVGKEFLRVHIGAVVLDVLSGILADWIEESDNPQMARDVAIRLLVFRIAHYRDDRKMVSELYGKLEPMLDELGASPEAIRRLVGDVAKVMGGKNG